MKNAKCEYRNTKKKTIRSSHFAFRISKRQGFTLIELVIYIALTSIVVVALLKIMLAVIGAQEKTEVTSHVQQELRMTMDRMTYTTRNAVSVNTGASIFSASGGKLSLAMSDSSLDPTLFFLSGNSIYVSEAGANTGAITSGKVLVDELQFINLTATGASPTIKIEVHGTDAVAGDDKTYENEMGISTSVTLRQ